MQSSQYVRIRTLIVFGSLVVIPLAALAGRSVGEYAGRVLDSDIWGLGTVSYWTRPMRRRLPATALSEAPRFRPSAREPGPLDSLSPGAVAADSHVTDGSLLAPEPTTRSTSVAGSPSPPSEAGSLLAPDVSVSVDAAETGRLFGIAEEGHPRAGQAATTASEADPLAGKTLLASHVTQADAGPAIDFSRLERQLRDEGATYYVLESWGGPQGLYRFQCRMPAEEGSAGRTQLFEATAASAIEAIEQVAREISRWRNRQQ